MRRGHSSQSFSIRFSKRNSYPMKNKSSFILMYLSFLIYIKRSESDITYLLDGISFLLFFLKGITVIYENDTELDVAVFVQADCFRICQNI